jgi:hypothetical protein
MPNRLSSLLLRKGCLHYEPVRDLGFNGVGLGIFDPCGWLNRDGELDRLP